MEIEILSLFPEFFESPLRVSIVQRAQQKGLVTIRLTNIRDFSKDKFHRVDDRPCGGGPGMILSPQPVVDAIRAVKRENSRVIYLSPQGKVLTQEKCEELAQLSHLVLLCGHYGGIDERIIESVVDEEVSIGDFILSSGCLPAMIVVDSVVRLLPGALGDPESAKEDSFPKGVFQAPQYASPDDFEGKKVPEILKTGHHGAIKEWRYKRGLEKMQRVRPDLYEKHRCRS